MAHASVTDSVVVPAPIGAVWAVVVDPGSIPRLDPRLTLVSSTGVNGEPGSAYVLRSPKGSATIDLHYRVESATPPSSLTTAVTIDGRESSHQVVSLARHDDGTLLTWTTRTRVPLLGIPLARGVMRGEMRKWLAAVSGLAASSS